jgi:hypothetical protein
MLFSKIIAVQATKKHKHFLVYEDKVLSPITLNEVVHIATKVLKIFVY